MRSCILSWGCAAREPRQRCLSWGVAVGLTAPPRKVKRRLYRIRYHVVELFIHRIKRSRAVATRYEKTARNYLALVHLVCAFVWLS
jgi:transposase